VLQFARDRRIEVIGTASAPHQDHLRSLGATATTYGPGLVERVHALAPTGVDAALDLAGSGVIPELIELTGDPAKVLSIADFFDIPVQQTHTLDAAGEAEDASGAGHVVGRFVITVS